MRRTVLSLLLTASLALPAWAGSPLFTDVTGKAGVGDAILFGSTVEARVLDSPTAP